MSRIALQNLVELNKGLIEPTTMPEFCGETQPNCGVLRVQLKRLAEQREFVAPHRHSEPVDRKICDRKCSGQSDRPASTEVDENLRSKPHKPDRGKIEIPLRQWHDDVRYG